MMFFRQVLLADNEYTESLFAQALLETKGLINQGLEAGILQPLVDIDAAATLLTAQAMANIIFLPQLESSLGGKLTDPVIASRLMATQQELMPFTKKPQEKANQ